MYSFILFIFISNTFILDYFFIKCNKIEDDDRCHDAYGALNFGGNEHQHYGFHEAFQHNHGTIKSLNEMVVFESKTFKASLGDLVICFLGLDLIIIVLAKKSYR